MMVVNEYLFSFSLLHLSLILIICGLISILQKYFLKFWSLRKFRGPYALPVVGNCYNPNAFSLLRYLTELKKKYGKTFVLCLFQKTYLVTMEPAVLRKFFTDTKAFVKCDNYRQLSSLVLGDSLATSTHEYHRHIFSQYFSLSNISSSLPLFQQITRDTTLELIDPHLGQNISIDIQLFFSRLALRMFLQYSMGYAYQQKEVREIEVCHAISNSSSALATVLMYSIPHWDFLPLVKTARRVRHEAHIDLLPIIQQRRQLIADSNNDKSVIPRDCLTTLIQSGLEDSQIFDHLLTLMCSAHDPVAYTAAFACLLLADNPSVQDRLRAEIFEALGSRDSLTVDDIVGIKYLNQVIQETLRLYCMLPCLSRVTTCSVTIKDASLSGEYMVIPENTDVLVPLYLVNRDPDHWIQPSKFMPERFDGKHEFSFACHGYFPFGNGTSECMGKIFAHVEISLFLCTLLRMYKFTPDPSYRVSITAGIYLATTNGVKVHITPLNEEKQTFLNS